MRWRYRCRYRRRWWLCRCWCPRQRRWRRPTASVARRRARYAIAPTPDRSGRGQRAAADFARALARSGLLARASPAESTDRRPAVLDSEERSTMRSPRPLEARRAAAWRYTRLPDTVTPRTRVGARLGRTWRKHKGRPLRNAIPPPRHG